MVIKSYPTGSRFICDPPPTDTDNDTVILVNGFYDWQSALEKEGWDDGGDYGGGDFISFRKGEENYICTEDPDFFSDYVKATNGAKALNLLKKKDRIALFEAVIEGAKGLDGLYSNDQGAVRREDGVFRRIGDIIRLEGRPFRVVYRDE